MPTAWIRSSVVAVAVLAAGCGGTSRVGDGLTSSSLGEAKKAVVLIKLGAADPLCNVLTAGIGVREGADYRLVQTARIVSNDPSSVAELELGSGEYHVVSYTCLRQGAGALNLAQPAGNGVFRKSYASFRAEPGEILNVGLLRLVPVGATRLVSASIVHVQLAVTDWPLPEIERFKQQRPKLYGQMKTRLMTVARVEPPTMAQVQAACAEMKRLQSEGKVQNLPPACSMPAGGTPPRYDGLAPRGSQPGDMSPPALQKRPGPAKKDVGA
jgi:hypothetical protein